MDIHFEYEGQTYVVSENAYNLNRIVLPDCRVIDVGYWLESKPPKPRDMSVSACCPHDKVTTAEQLAKDVNGALARLA